jgi:hypothetical protein
MEENIMVWLLGFPLWGHRLISAVLDDNKYSGSAYMFLRQFWTEQMRNSCFNAAHMTGLVGLFLLMSDTALIGSLGMMTMEMLGSASYFTVLVSAG